MGRSPIVQPPGKGTIARPRRANNGPRTQILARIRRTSAAGARQTRRSTTSNRNASSWRVTSTPNERSKLLKVCTSVTCGTRSSSSGASVSSEAAMIGKAAFLLPATDTRPWSTAGPVILSTSMCAR